jgi:hypothetical protein
VEAWIVGPRPVNKIIQAPNQRIRDDFPPLVPFGIGSIKRVARLILPRISNLEWIIVAPLEGVLNDSVLAGCAAGPAQLQAERK